MGKLLGKLLLAAVFVSLGTTSAGAVPVLLRTGLNTNTTGYLEVTPDEYGSWANFIPATPFDRFRPTGSSLQPVAFTAGFFLFVGGTQRELLSDSTDWQNTYPADASLARVVTSLNVASDTNGDTANDTSVSAFSVTGGTTSLGFGLIQRVISGGPGVAAMIQDYSITNNGSSQISFSMLRSLDADLIWGGDFANDSVGTGTNGSALDRYVYMSEVGQPAQSITLSGAAGVHYYGGKNGVDPDGVGPGIPYGFGTDLQQWNAFGVPSTWENHIAGVGYNTNGDSGAAPTGTTVPGDAFVGLDFHITLDAGASTTLQVVHTYGQTTPIPEPSTMSLLALGILALRRRN